MLGWANDFLAQPWPALTFAVLAVVAALAHRPVARRLGWAPWPTLGAMLGAAAVATLTLLPAPGTPLAGPDLGAIGSCAGALFDPAALWHAFTTTADRGERVGNVLMFVPMTFFAILASRRPGLVAGVAVLVPVAIEFTQVVMSAGRACIANDWVNNAIGAVLGVLLGVLVSRMSTRQHARVGESPPR
ncbi:VanZ family protein [Phytohabitans sp. ZYX-F-186]|uniref:VanZ family protein n=1 Tax=Phytohabitans maris TaxID=3071409 RepID=A0ABU0ZTA9_9ACTN|nr:VanZ family protein [Phytohabitans sp. ZYX-F-186]MDQ7910276.1 VanZ family protein [Phytohabitans sp. ZYX-F-186]